MQKLLERRTSKEEGARMEEATDGELQRNQRKSRARGDGGRANAKMQAPSKMEEKAMKAERRKKKEFKRELKKEE